MLMRTSKKRFGEMRHPASAGQLTAIIQTKSNMSRCNTVPLLLYGLVLVLNRISELVALPKSLLTRVESGLKRSVTRLVASYVYNGL